MVRARLGADEEPGRLPRQEEPAARAAGIKVGSVDELVSKLKEAGAV